MSEQSNLKAAFWMVCSLGCMLVMTWSGREITRDLSVFQAMEMRSVIGLLLLLPLVHRAGGLRAMRTLRPGAHIARNIAHYSGQYAWVAGLSMIPLAQLIAIEFTAPIWTALLAMAFLRERMTAWKTAAILFGLAGVLVIVRPGVDVSPGQLVVLFAAMAFGVSVTLVKALTRTDSAVTIIFWMLVIQSVIGVVPAVVLWKAPEASQWPWAILFGFGGGYAHYCMARAMAHADATVVMPMDFLRVPATALLGWLAYSETIDIYTAIGAALILFGNLFNLGGRRKPPAPVAP
jgi:drug/metabolite transporter (DMT)-like permease